MQSRLTGTCLLLFTSKERPYLIPQCPTHPPPTQPWFHSSISPPSLSLHTLTALSNYGKTRLWQKNLSVAGLLFASTELKTVRLFDVNPSLTEKGPVVANRKPDLRY